MRLSIPLRAACAACLAVAAISLAGAASSESSPDPLRILILPIVVHSAVPDASHVSGGLSDMLASRLEQSGELVVERPEDPALASSRIADALREGRARGSDFVVFGAFTQFGDGASLDIQCIPTDVASEGEAAAARRIFIQSGAVGEIIPRLDEIAGRLSTYVNAGRPARAQVADAAAGPAPAAGAGTPASPDALRELADRLEALEEAVFGGADASAAAQFGEPPPES